MKNLSSIVNYEVLLFDIHSKRNPLNKTNALKEFLHYIKFNGNTGPISFSYASGSETIHPHKSIKENFILDAVSSSVIKNKEDNFREKMKVLRNQKINTLIESLEPIERNCSQYDTESIATISIVKAMLSESDFLFLVNPDEVKTPEVLNLIKECLRFEVETNGRRIFIMSSYPEKWLDLTTSIVQKNKYFQFTKKENAMCTLKKKETIIHSIQNFALYKKAS
jgi:hypothetical protein